jgi:hypothetical protein
MIYTAERNVRTALEGFHYSDMGNECFLTSLPYVKQTGNRIIYEIRFPNQPINQNNSIFLCLKKRKLKVTKVTEFYNDQGENSKVHTDIDFLYLLENLTQISDYDKFVAMVFLSQTNFNL